MAMESRKIKSCKVMHRTMLKKVKRGDYNEKVVLKDWFYFGIDGLVASIFAANRVCVLLHFDYRY